MPCSRQPLEGATGSGRACGDVAHDGDRHRVGDRAPMPLAEHNASGNVGLAGQITFPLEDPQVVVDHGCGADLASMLDVPHSGRVLVLFHEPDNKVHDVLLLFRQLLRGHVFSPTSVCFIFSRVLASFKPSNRAFQEAEALEKRCSGQNLALKIYHVNPSHDATALRSGSSRNLGSKTGG